MKHRTFWIQPVAGSWLHSLFSIAILVQDPGVLRKAAPPPVRRLIVVSLFCIRSLNVAEVLQGDDGTTEQEGSC